MRTAVMTLALVSALLASGLLACGRQTPEANALGNDSFDVQDYAGAIEAYRLAQESSPDLPEPFYNSGNAQHRQESYDEALSSYDQAQLNAGEDLTGSIHFNRGNVHFNRETYGEAAEAYREVLRLNPDDADAKHNLELTLRQIAAGTGAAGPAATGSAGPTGSATTGGAGTAAVWRAGAGLAGRPG